MVSLQLENLQWICLIPEEDSMFLKTYKTLSNLAHYSLASFPPTLSLIRATAAAMASLLSQNTQGHFRPDAGFFTSGSVHTECFYLNIHRDWSLISCQFLLKCPVFKIAKPPFPSFGLPYLLFLPFPHRICQHYYIFYLWMSLLPFFLY